KDLADNITDLGSETKLNKKDKKKLNKLQHMSKENDQNFEDYIRKNELPKGYKKGTELAGKYTKETNDYLNQLTSKLQKLDKKDTKEIDKLNSKYKDKVNGKQQKKVEKFLKDKDIETKAFEK
ncbi:TPA: NDxxF motif lipoprotein, partial [Streptococcus pyogenes]|nr:NDxxF motif lipoprotein [Streptococcus pyogenes]